MKICPKCQTRYDLSERFCSVDSEVLVADPSVLVGTTLDGIFVIEALLGEGAMGTVYRARHVALGDTVAIKVLKLGHGDEDKWLRRFQREGRAARRFRHPNVVAVHDLRVTSDGVAYMVQEFVEGRTLRQELREGRMRLSETLAILEPLASALDAGHRSGVVHRDLKPDNVMIQRVEGGAPVVKLLDLGIAKLVGFDELGVQPASTLTLAGQILGTPHYMSPEQWGEIPKDGSTDIDGRADVYSLAVMTYELLTGTWPIRGLDVHSVRAGHLAGSVPSVREIVKHLPADIDVVIRRGMALDRRDRYSTPIEFVAALAAVAAEHPETSDQNSIQTRRILPSADDPTAVLASGIIDSGRRNGGAGRQAMTAEWSDDGPSPGAINSKPTDLGLPVAAESAGGDVSGGTAPPADSSTVVTQASGGRAPAWRPPWIAVAALTIGVLLIGALVVWAFRSPGTEAPPTVAIAPPVPAVIPVAATCTVDVIARDGRVLRQSARPIVNADEWIRLRLETLESEFVYVLIAGAGNVPTLLLGDVPWVDAGIASNRTTRGVDFVFPSPDGRKFDRIDIANDARTTPITIIVSQTSLMSLGWPGVVTPHELSSDEQASLARLLSASAEASVAEEDASTGRLQVRRPEGSESRPLVLTINVTNSAVPAS
jgi:serine/threonine-protein kinase